MPPTGSPYRAAPPPMPGAYDRNPLRVPTDPNSSTYAGVFIARAWSPSGPPRWVSDRLRAQVAAGLITWRWAMVAQAKMARQRQVRQVVK